HPDPVRGAGDGSMLAAGSRLFPRLDQYGNFPVFRRSHEVVTPGVQQLLPGGGHITAPLRCVRSGSGGGRYLEGRIVAVGDESCAERGIAVALGGALPVVRIE